MGGIAKLEAGAAIVAGEAVCTESDGKGVATATPADFCVGIALEAASGDGVIFSVAMLPHTYTA